jgi:hypothetical protein
MIKMFARSFRNEEEATVEGVEVWSVRWTAVTGEYSSSKIPVAEFFSSQEAAKEFEKALKDAFKLTRNSLNYITVKKESNT